MTESAILKAQQKFEGNKLALMFSAIWIVNDALKL